jgi:hypothetical protein
LQVDGPTQPSPSVHELGKILGKDIIDVSSNKGDSPCDLSIFELGSGGFPSLVQNATHQTSSNSSTGSDWFDPGLAPEDVPNEE